MLPDGNEGLPAARPVRHQVAADTAVELRREALIQGPGGEFRLVEGGFEAQDALGQEGCYFRIGEDAPGGFEETGGSIRSSIPCRKRNSTGSCSKAMLWATSWGTRRSTSAPWTRSG